MVRCLPATVLTLVLVAADARAEVIATVQKTFDETDQSTPRSDFDSFTYVLA